jgi:hypothetical protein
MSRVTPIKDTAFDRLSEDWGPTPPGWISELAKACDESSQAAIARRIGKSASLVNQVLRNRYTGDLEAVRRSVERVLDINEVLCPILGAIKGDTCLTNQRKSYSPNNHQAVALFRACRRCPHNISKKGDGDGR